MPPSTSLTEAAAHIALERPAIHPPRIAERTAVSVEITTGARLAEIQSDWRDLVARADVANVFMHPVVIALGAQYPNARCVTLLGWRDNGGYRQLTGLWAFNVGRAPCAIIPISVLVAPPFAHTYLAAPVIDRDVLDETLSAMLECIAGDPSPAENSRARRHARRQRHHASARPRA